METSGFRADHNHRQSHVPQQSRRHKLRVQQQVLGSTPISQHLDSPLNLDHHQQHLFSFHQDQVNGDNEVNIRHNNFLFDHSHQGMVSTSSEILDFSRNATARLSSEAPHPTFTVHWNRSSLNPNNVVPQSFESWPLATTSLFSSHSLALGNSDMIENDQVVTVASTSNNELALLPFSFASQDHHNPHHHHHSLTSPSVVSDNSNNNNSNLQGLSLSLSSIYPQQASATTALPNMAAHQIIDNHHHRHQESSDSDQDLPKDAKHCLAPKPSIISKPCGKSLQDIVGVSSGGAYRANLGPLGPFTGYATILRNSRFLKPAQQLMEEFCGPKVAVIAMSKGIDHVNSDSDILDHDPHQHHRQVLMGNVNISNNGNACASSSTFYGLSEMNGGDQEGGRVGSNLSFESGSSSSRPEHVQQKKAKLLHMQEEVSRRYKQYRQQMQMVVSSFESVSGLSSATPYISLALKAVSRHFRGLKSTIADQLNHTRRALGEDLMSPLTGAKDTMRFKYNVEQGPQKPHRSSGPNLAFHEPQQHHIWRPQRGLPERSVAVLRAWLFEHFLHPYPTDTDKHMLATQTGLTRNQVSNWFINARVRVWKPMVEEIHTLETKGMSTGQLENNNNNRHNDSSSNDHQAATSAKQLDCAGASTLSALGHNNRASMLLGADQHAEHGQEKRSTLEFSSTSHEASLSLAGSVVQGFVPYHRNGLEVWSRAEQ